MSSIEISLPDDLKKFVDAEAAAAGYEGPAPYVRELLRILWKQKSRSELEAKLIEATESEPAIEATPQFWDELRARVHQRAGNDRA